jgi:hypothetical protein
VAKRKKIKFIYTGKGFFNGLPARDMTEDEWLSYPKELTKPAITQGLYFVVDDEKNEVKNA